MLTIQKTKIMASGPITSREVDGETVEAMSDFILGGSKITAHGDCSHEIKRRLLLGRKVMTNLDSIFKSRGIILPTKVRLVKAMVFPDPGQRGGRPGLQRLEERLFRDGGPCLCGPGQRKPRLHQQHGQDQRIRYSVGHRPGYFPEGQ